MSTLLIFPSNIPWNVATESTSSRLILAVKGFTRVNEVEAIPVLMMSRGNVKEALLIRVCRRAGIVTGDKWICDRADLRD